MLKSRNGKVYFIVYKVTKTIQTARKYHNIQIRHVHWQQSHEVKKETSQNLSLETNFISL